jgi:hypothetical protein
MNKARWVSAAAGTAVLVAGLALPAGAAFADGPSGDGNSGVLSVLSGNDVNAPVSLPVDVCGVAVSLLGGANAGCAGGAASNTVINDGGGSGGGNGNAGVISAGSGNTVNLPVSVPVSVCGVSGAAAGFSNSGCKGGAASNTVIQGGNGGGGNGNAGDISALSGNTVNAPISAPADVCGIAVALLGFSNASCVGGAASNTVINNGGGSGSGNGNAGSISALSGNTVNAPVSVPVNVCGVSAAVAGFANSGCKGGAASNTVIGGSGGSGNGNSGGLSLLSGNNVNAPISAPVNVCGIAVGLLGFSNAGCQGGSFSNVITPPGGGQPTPCPTPPPTCKCTPPPPCKHHHPHTPPSTPPTTPGTPPTTPGTPPTTPGTPPGGHGNGTPPGSQGGGTTTTVPGSLPITGADLLGIGIAAVGAIGIGGTALVMARRRRNGEV